MSYDNQRALDNYDSDLYRSVERHMELQEGAQEEAEQMVACPYCGAAANPADHVAWETRGIHCECGALFTPDAEEPWPDPFRGEPESTDPARDLANHRELARLARRLQGER